ncbi:uncharacterized protein EDB93DRAFT_1094642 [Suillus bovinus]|uniref:uncharacterized protein n=1 Tax=Suillus bovinus TaxID=48563 RepID=UPI001B8739ED|nr:uncharacterized protein EDB93DRAFT_1094642 [Suillus bovinus]KAG2130808.1 hypothetical protein EDB93DRAFT_1094642 [Suillus bovinus]
MEVVKTGNAKQWFKSPLNELVTVPEVELLCDVCMRWDSTYFMINRLRAMRPAIDFFLSMPNQQDISGHKMTNSEWQVLKDLEKILDVPHRVQQRMSSKSMPQLGSAVPCFELFMTAWESLATKFP